MGHFIDGAIGLQVRVVCGTRESARSESRETAVERCALDRLKPERRGRGQCAELKARTKVLVAMRSANRSSSDGEIAMITLPIRSTAILGSSRRVEYGAPDSERTSSTSA